VVRKGLRLLLDGEKGFEVVAEAGTAEDACVRAWPSPGGARLDLNMPGELTALDAIPDVQAAGEGTRVVVLTMQEDPEFARRALGSGAAGYVLKEAARRRARRGGPPRRRRRHLPQPRASAPRWLLRRRGPRARRTTSPSASSRSCA
jgi:CheY-like chemotaxis protein